MLSLGFQALDVQFLLLFHLKHILNYPVHHPLLIVHSAALYGGLPVHSSSLYGGLTVHHKEQKSGLTVHHEELQSGLSKEDGELEKMGYDLSGTAKEIVRLMIENPMITYNELSAKLGKARSGIAKQIKKLIDDNIIESKEKKGVWIVKDIEGLQGQIPLIRKNDNI